MDEKITGFVKKVRGRLREQAIVDAVIVSVIVGLLFAVLISIISLWISMYYAIPISIGVVLLSFSAGIVLGIRRTPSLTRSALMADARGHKEKITTALELIGREDAFSILQKKDALKVIDNFKVKKEFPLQFSWKKSMVFVILAVIFAVTGTLDTPARRLAVTNHEVRKESLDEIAKLERVQKELEKSDGLSELEKTEISEQLEQAKQDLKRAETVEDLTKAAERITKKMEMDAEQLSDASAKEMLTKAVEENKADQAKRVEDAIQEAEEAIAKAGSGDEKDQRDAYDKMKKMAETMGDEELKQKAEDYLNSDFSNQEYLTASSAVKDAKESKEAVELASSNNGQVSDGGNENQNGASNQNGNSAGDSQDGQDNANGGQGNSGQNGSDSNQTGNSGQQGNSGNNGESGEQGNSGSNGNGGQSGEQENNGNSGNNGQQGNGGQNGNNGDGGQSGEGNQNGNGGSGGNGAGNSDNGGGSGSGNGGGWNRGSTKGIEGAAKTDESVVIPEGELGEDEDLTGQANGNDTSTKQKSSQGNTWSGNKVSYGQVSGQYKEKAYKKVDGSSYPSRMKDKIRDYFDGLN